MENSSLDDAENYLFTFTLMITQRNIDFRTLVTLTLFNGTVQKSVVR